jgi:hypothetical protein
MSVSIVRLGTPALMSCLLLMGIVALAIVRHWRIPNVWVEYPVNPGSRGWSRVRTGRFTEIAGP